MKANWTFLTSRAWALLCIADDLEVRLRDMAASRGITERSAYGTVTDPAGADYVVRQKNGRRNRCQTRAHPAPLRRAVVEGSRYGGAADLSP
jgi:hypothetical protein